MIKLWSSPLPAAVDLPVIVQEPIPVIELFALAHHPRAGGIVLFSGEIRNHNAGKEVAYLEYEAYTSMAEKMIREITAAAKEKWDLHVALCVHRIGRLEICESAVVVITAHAHRSEAYEANQYIINRVKHEVPIWKNEFYTDGSSQWGGNCNCH
ncbi:MAG TPA: molybdenum cofactor biosynthesis protein MoaE [Cytophagaceae bacterium]|jgi:molybdopterin synthase catalytic subunit|nr:molybdenum cofactor biosynthesis protein MoaE [Cytophagaceae bacterium]